MSKAVVISLYGYLGTLAVTQTVYGSHFMNTRWVTLGVLVIACGFYWFSAKTYALDPSDDKSNLLILVYFAMTFLSIVAAENPLFSGMKWISHVLMLLVFVVFLRQSLEASQVQTGGVVFKRNHRHFTLCFMDEPRVAGIVFRCAALRGGLRSQIPWVR